jgi:hypothetical protein
MYKFLKLLGMLAVLTSSTGYASAATIQEDFIFSYSSNGSFNLTSLSYSTGGVNQLTSSPYTSSIAGPGNLLSGSGKLSEIISVDTTKSYTSGYSILNATGNIQSFGVTVSPVPLPASFPLFVTALLALGLVGYRSTRTNSRVAA